MLYAVSNKSVLPLRINKNITYNAIAVVAWRTAKCVTLLIASTILSASFAGSILLIIVVRNFLNRVGMFFK